MFDLNVDAKIGESFLRGKHSTGLDVCVMPKKGFNKYYAVYATKYGSMNNKFLVNDQKITVPDGTAHFLEHKLFENEDGTNASDSFSKIGASPNAFTSFNVTAYLFCCTENFYENLDLLVNFVNHPHFTDENVAKEQGIIGQEIRMYEDDPRWRVFVNLLNGMYQNNSVKIDIAGTVQSISQITPQMLYDCYNTFYTPSNMTLFVVGDVDEGKIVECLDKRVLERDVKRVTQIYDDEPLKVDREIVKQSLSVSMPLFQIGFKDTTASEGGATLMKRDLTTKILLDVLVGTSQDFYMKLYNKGLINENFDWETEFELEYGFSMLSGESKDPFAVYELLINHIRDTRKSGVDFDDAERAKKVMIGKYLKLFNNIERMGNHFMKMLFSKVNVFDTLRVINEITIDDISRRLETSFLPACSTISVIEPV